jgi:thiamine-monophosphate kinase
MEFNLIQQYFQSHPQNRDDVILGIGDDCALLSPPIGQQLAMSTDTLVQGIHYYPDANPHALGHKSLAVSLSDLASMGSTPAWVMLSLTLDKSQQNQEWIKAFCDGFFALLDQYSMTLIGGNLSSGPPSITTQISGFVRTGKGLRRSGARPGDKIYVTNNLGDAALALAGIEGCIQVDEQLAALKQSLDYPQPRVQDGLQLLDIASAAIDISDGLAADLGHILQQSNVGATLHIEHLPLSQTAYDLISSQKLSFQTVAQYALTGGDDYELCFTASPDKSIELDEQYACIGVIQKALGLRLLHQGRPFNIDRKGYEHFSLNVAF